MREVADAAPDGELIATLDAAAVALHAEEVERCHLIGDHGAALIPDGGAVLTHCNAGALATGGYGTALGVIRSAHSRDPSISVWVDETRPLLQGARLTAWELVEDGIPATLVTDSMAGWLMAQGRVQAVVTGADRVARNGDAANKIGTYALSVLAGAHGVPFYIAAPSSTIDATLASGAEIPIEHRDPSEVRGGQAAAGDRRLQSRLRRDPGREHHRHRHRARRPPTALRPWLISPPSSTRSTRTLPRRWSTGGSTGAGCWAGPSTCCRATARRTGCAAR